MSRLKYLLIFLLLAGCSQPKSVDLEPFSSSHEKFLQLARDDYNLDLRVFPLKNTLWVYYPIEDDLLTIKANKDGTKKVSKEAKEQPTLKFADATFKDNKFRIEYEVSMSRYYAKNYGYGTSFNERFQTIQRHITSAVHRSFADVDGENGMASDTPKFMVIVIADVKNGLASRMTLALEDVFRVLVDQGFGEEYVRRAIVDYPTGNQEIINDYEGEHLDLVDFSLGEFIARQITYRINFRYTRSAFPPGPDSDAAEIMAIAAANAIAAYDFNDFSGAEFVDFSDGITRTINRDQLMMKAEDPKPKGKLHKIQFDYSK